MKRNLFSRLGLEAMVVFFIASTSVSAATQIVDRIVAVVNEDIILLSELNHRMQPYKQRILEQKYDKEKERKMIFKVREEILNRLVNEKLTDQEIKRMDIQVDDEQIDRTIEQIKAANSFTDEDLRGYLEHDQMTMAQYRDQIKEQILRSRLVNYEIKSKIVITEEDIKAYHDSHPEIYAGKQRYHLRNILMKVPDYSTAADKQAVHDRMQALKNRIEAGESFADLANAYSQGPTAAKGGDIGEFAVDFLSPVIRDALKGLSPGQTTAVLDTDQGFQLFYVEALSHSEDKPLESVKEEIHQKLYKEVVDKKFYSWLEDLRKQSHIKIIN